MMKTLLLSLSFSLLGITVTAQVTPIGLVGAWQFTEPSGTRTVLSFTADYFIQTVCEPDNR